MERYNKSLARDATEEYVKVAQKYGLTPTQLALAWCRCGSGRMQAVRVLVLTCMYVMCAA
jgi:aryl-alcohol dehydrogenase-like predicted oxidoreductase